MANRKKYQPATKKSSPKPKKSRKRKDPAYNKRVSNEPLRKQLEVLVNQANKRLERLTRMGYDTRAVAEAQRTMVSVHRETGQLFTSKLSRTRDIQREFARVNTFLSDYTSLAEGAENFNADLNRFFKKGMDAPRLFGGQFEDGYNSAEITYNRAQKVFDIYRRVLEVAGGWERVVGIFRNPNTKVEYGSDVLINEIYDMVDQGFNTEDTIFRAWQMVDAAQNMYDEMATKQASNVDYGRVSTKIDPLLMEKLNNYRKMDRNTVNTHPDDIITRYNMQPIKRGHRRWDS